MSVPEKILRRISERDLVQFAQDGKYPMTDQDAAFDPPRPAQQYTLDQAFAHLVLDLSRRLTMAEDELRDLRVEMNEIGK